MKSKLQKNIAIVGPTASGKSELAVKIAKRFNGEIISADSRQVYRGLDIGTGKVSGNWKIIFRPSDNVIAREHIRSAQYRLRDRSNLKRSYKYKIASLPAVARNDEIQFSNDRTSKIFRYKNIPHHCIDIVSPKKVFTVSDFKKCAETAIKDITSRGKIPILCGGTGFYIDSVLYNLPIPNVPPNTKLRAQLSKKSAAELYQILKKLDQKRAKTIDPHNPRRLVRAIEIVKATGSPIPFTSRPGLGFKTGSLYDALILGIKVPKEKLYKRIDKRLRQHLKQGMIQEVKNLLKKSVSHKRLQSLGLEYRFISLYLQNKLAYKEMTEKLKNAIHQYSKRQMTWFKRSKDIRWIQSNQKTEKIAMKLSQRFLKIPNF